MAGEVGQPEVEHDDVGLVVGGVLDRLGAVMRLRDHVEAAVEAQRVVDETTHVDDVIDEEDPDRHARSLATFGRLRRVRRHRDGEGHHE